MAIDTLEYNPLEDLTCILSTPESLTQIEELIQATSAYKLQLQNHILEQQENSGGNGNTLPDVSDFDSVFDEIKEIRSISQSTEFTISQLTKDISHLDDGKRNLTQAMTCFENLKLLSDSYVQCRQYLEHNRFKEMCSPYKVMCSLSETFRDYKSVDEINKLLSLISRLQADTLSRTKQCYHQIFSSRETSSIDDDVLREGACELLDTSSNSRLEIVDWCLDKLLYEMGEIFQIDDEAGSLENLPRRYIFFKKVLNNFNSNFANYFPSSWDMSMKLTSRFFSMTRRDLQILLRRELQNNPSIDLFMDSLQNTLDFEKYINVKFANRFKIDQEDSKHKISACFEPYLTLWISHQDKMMNSKILSYMSETKFPKPSESLVIPSSADLFRTYRSILTQTLELVEGEGRDQILIELGKFFTKCLIDYSKRVLEPLSLSDETKIENKDEAINYTVLLVNTADYCSTTIDQLDEKLSEFVHPGEKITVIFDKAKSLYGRLISRGINFLLDRILSSELNFSWREFENFDWRHVAVEDYSRYMVTLKNILAFSTDNAAKSDLQKILSQFNRDVYSWNFLDKVIDLITDEFLGCIIKLLQPLPPLATLGNEAKFDPKGVISIGEQLLLDVELLKQLMYSLPECLSNESSTQNTSYKRVNKHITSNIDLLVRFIKLLVVPTESPDIYQENFSRLTDNNMNSAVWAFIIALKGIPWDLGKWKSLWSEFEVTTEGDRQDLFVFQRSKSSLTQFSNSFSRVSDPTWRKFIHEELRIMPSKITKVLPSTPRSTSVPPKPQTNKLNENIKNLMSNSRFFNRGT